MAKPIIVELDEADLEDLSCTTSIVFDASGYPLDDLLEGLCIDVNNGKVQIRWGQGFGDHFLPWRPPFNPVSFSVYGREYVFCLDGQQEQPATRVTIQEQSFEPNKDRDRDPDCSEAPPTPPPSA